MTIKSFKALFSSPLACFLLYVTVIIVFAVCYCMLPNQFYHMNIMKEQEFNDLQNVVKGQFKQLLSSAIQNDDKEKYIMIDDNKKYRLKVDSIAVERYNYKEPSFDITVHVLSNEAYVYQEEHAYMEYAISYNVKLVGTRIIMADKSVLQTAKLEQTNRVYDPIKSEETNDLIDISPVFKGKNWSFAIKVSRALDENLRKIENAQDGYASYVENNFFRMLYLSVVTITTLGFGDIVPITDMARLGIGIEAFLGVMIAGLFVNAIIQKTCSEK